MAVARPRSRRSEARGRLLGWGLLFLLAAPAAAQEQAGLSPHGSLPLPCTACHTADGWRPARISRDFSHARFGFPLQAGHAAVPCSACHTSLEFAKVEASCAGCHRDAHQGELGTDCSQCHNTRAFGDRSTLQQLHALSRFPLEGAHRALDCASCHTSRAGASLAFRGAPTDCISCHRTEFQKTTSPNHPSAGFPTSCTNCHSTTTWAGSGFNHAATQFPLTGAHQAVSCQACHGDGVYDGNPTTCVACHQTDFSGTTNPPHQAAGFPTDCTGCHTTTTWTGTPFDHGTTQFPLTGAHQAATCQSCHADGVYDGKPTTCVSCHQTSFNATTNPPHQAAGFPTTCTSCHTTTTWVGAVFNHGTTQFPLTGAHQAATCQSCHADGVYDGKPTTCVSCHQTDYSGTTNPPHQSAGFPTSCTSCHTTSTWVGAVFNHGTTQFPLTGAHVTATCQSCHADGVYDGKSTACFSCHQTDYSGTTNPAHQSAGFPTTCTTCHTTVQWLGATFNHDGAYFPIYSGKHQGKWTSCAQCHSNPAAYAQFTCLTCHEHNKTDMDADHQGRAGYSYQSTACYGCHPRGD